MNGLTIDAHEDLSQLAQADAVLVGSGMKTREVANTPALMEQLRALNPERQLLAAQCRGLPGFADFGWGAAWSLLGGRF